ncbi:hypothetical protein GCK32_018625, partial [Trichostrongylus colubriformis]
FATALGTSAACITMKSGEDKMSTNGYGHGMARAASHAGSWYSSNPKELDRQISRWLDAAGDRTRWVFILWGYCSSCFQTNRA